jgi:hypothetical protein
LCFSANAVFAKLALKAGTELTGRRVDNTPDRSLLAPLPKFFLPISAVIILDD